MLSSSATKMRLKLPLTFAVFSTMLTRAASTTTTMSDAAPPSASNKIRGAFFGSLVGDALCLGSHYEYDALKIKEAYNGTIQNYMACGEKMSSMTNGIGWGQRNYHPGTVAGDQTDYGEYQILILEYTSTLSTATAQKFEVAELLPLWQKRLTTNWKQWICTQAKQTFQQVQQGTPISQIGGMSNAMALRFASVYGYYDDEEAVVDTALKSMFTHRETTAKQGCEFFARVTFRVIHSNLTPRQAIEQVASSSPPFIQQKVKQAISKFDEATDANRALYNEEYVDDIALTSMARLWDVGKSEPIKVGKASPTEGTLPGAIYFILKYEHDYVAAVKANTMCGGDNASRAIAIGMVLGAHHGVEVIPTELRTSLNNWDYTEKLMEGLPLLAGSGGEL